MAQMGEVKPRELWDGQVLYPNPAVWAFVPGCPLAIILGTMISLPMMFRVFTTTEICILLPIIIFVMGWVLVALGSTQIIFEVVIGERHVILKYLFKNKRIVPEDIDRIVIDPPVLSDSLKYKWWGEIDSKLTFHFKDGSKLLTAFFPNGVKLRIARVLDPENFPPAD